MAVVSRIATITQDGGALGSRTFQATADIQDTAAGVGVVVTVTNAATGLTPPAVPDSFTLAFYNDAGTLIRTVTLNNSSGSQSTTFYFTNNGLTGGAARCGTVEIKLRATKTTGGPTATYDIETDGAPNTAQVGFTLTVLNRGWIRGTTTVIEAVSNVSLGGAQIEPAQVDESLYVRTTSEHVSYVARALTVASSAGALSSATNSTTAAERDVTFANVCDNRFPAAVTTVGWTVTVPNATLTGSPDWTNTTTTDDDIDVDPRLTCEHLMQIDNDVFATPPLSLNDDDDIRVFPQAGYLSTNIRAARGTRVADVITGGVNGLTVTITVDPVSPGSTITFAGRTTDTEGGEDGWASLSGVMTAWTQTAPSGSWQKDVTITAPADKVGAAYLLNSSYTYAFAVVDSNYQAAFYINQIGNGGRHPLAGDTFRIIATLTDLTTLTRLTPDAAEVWMTHVNAAAVLEYLNDDADDTSAAWETWGPTDVATTFPLAPLGGDITLLFKDFENTSGWSTSDILVRVFVTYQGSKYVAVIPRELTGVYGQHDLPLIRVLP